MDMDMGIGIGIGIGMGMGMGMDRQHGGMAGERHGMAMDKGRAWASAWGMEMGQGPPGRFGGRGQRAGRVSASFRVVVVVIVAEKRSRGGRGGRLDGVLERLKYQSQSEKEEEVEVEE
ncbi:hypothetical protein TRV_02230 [Trichophyton verrucosum HKI 0517]|uniref:Uncharacterized protein n=1 Tax=Trichophyton verrucosum (strain HKI 0517) TaxID=663202 RepID=D4D560_TRIVH|nr:uncharacterized protein TRV_02230 [Trichophyton verrucosum HKI 0517]EFE43037.1 hypothetical protein TRV_02230 [Trichophyton verrucosum HKI 0517]